MQKYDLSSSTNRTVLSRSTLTELVSYHYYNCMKNVFRENKNEEHACTINLFGGGEDFCEEQRGK